MDLEDLERTLRDRLHALGPAPRATLQLFLSLPDHEGARRIGDLYGDPRTQTFAELLIDLEESLQLVPWCWVSFGSRSFAGSPEGLH